MANINFNVKSGKVFRDSLALFVSAKLNESRINKSECIAKWTPMIENAKAILEKIQNNDLVGLVNPPTVEEQERIISNYEAMFKTELANLDAEVDAKVAAEKKGRTLVSDKLFASIVKACSDLYGEEAEVELQNALCEWFQQNGFADATVENTKAFYKACYSGLKINSLQQMIKKNDTSFGIKSKPQIIDAFLWSIYNEPSMKAMLKPTCEKFTRIWNADLKCFTKIAQ